MLLARLWISSWISTVLPTPAPPNSPTLPPLRVRGEQVDHLDARLEHLGRRRQVLDGGASWWMPPRSTSGGQILAEVDRLAEQVEDAPERRLADRHRDRRAGVDHLGAPREAVGGVHRDRPHAVVAEVLLHLAHEQLVPRPRRDARAPPPGPPGARP